MPIKAVMKKAAPPPDLIIDPAHELTTPQQTDGTPEPEKKQPAQHGNDVALIAIGAVVVLILLLALLSLNLE